MRRRAPTHADLVALAVRWLRRSKRCGVVLQEPPPQRAAESPDAIGWYGGYSTMVECKVSRADFRADQRKYGRQRGPRLAWRCYYLAPAGLLAVEEIPDAWGLLEARGSRVTVVKQPPEQFDQRSADELRSELQLLYAELRRYHVQGLTYQKVAGQPAQRHLLDLMGWPDVDIRDARRLLGLQGR